MHCPSASRFNVLYLPLCEASEYSTQKRFPCFAVLLFSAKYLLDEMKNKAVLGCLITA